MLEVGATVQHLNTIYSFEVHIMVVSVEHEIKLRYLLAQSEVAGVAHMRQCNDNIAFLHVTKLIHFFLRILYKVDIVELSKIVFG